MLLLLTFDAGDVDARSSDCIAIRRIEEDENELVQRGDRVYVVVVIGE